jgi:Biotin synthase and related enzymes
MEEDEIVNLALHIASLGVKTIVLQSGDDFYYTQSMLYGIISQIKEKADVAITLSVGERPFEDYRAFKLAGADRYLLKHETASEELYKKLHPHQSLRKRLEILEYLRKTGYQIGPGNIVGLPGQSMEDLCADILLLKELDADMSSVGLFIPQHDTPLSEAPRGDLSLTLRVLALARIATRNSHMPVTTAIATADPERGLFRGLKAGANVIMPNFTPERHRKDYTIYDNKAHITLENAKETIQKAKRLISSHKGDSLMRHSRIRKSEVSNQK